MNEKRTSIRTHSCRMAGVRNYELKTFEHRAQFLQRIIALGERELGISEMSDIGLITVYTRA